MPTLEVLEVRGGLARRRKHIPLEVRGGWARRRKHIPFFTAFDMVCKGLGFSPNFFSPNFFGLFFSFRVNFLGLTS